MNNDLEEKFREHLKNDVHMHRKEYDKLLNQLKDRDQEIERLKAIIERGNEIRNNWENNEYQEAAHYNWLDDENHRIEQHGLNLELQLKERDELIKEAIPYVEYAIKYSTPLSQKIAEELLEKAREFTNED